VYKYRDFSDIGAKFGKFIKQAFSESKNHLKLNPIGPLGGNRAIRGKSSLFLFLGTRWAAGPSVANRHYKMPHKLYVSITAVKHLLLNSLITVNVIVYTTRESPYFIKAGRCEIS
jgi:hypothetical protein